MLSPGFGALLKQLFSKFFDGSFIEFGVNKRKKFEIKVREIELKDIDLIADYWLESKPIFLINMGIDSNKLSYKKRINRNAC